MSQILHKTQCYYHLELSSKRQISENTTHRFKFSQSRTSKILDEQTYKHNTRDKNLRQKVRVTHTNVEQRQAGGIA